MMLYATLRDILQPPPPIHLVHAGKKVQGKEKGVWGGVYMDLGRTDHDYNKHKTPEDWKALKKLHGKNIL